ncbi:C4b-binding protein alpha chain-like isoform X2 [Nycticebus coucang]|uniref:C4b-binding protein alpha chain-like isoform X2 n=1 Tax=Nycticebus coucang TaxID=9470 RepID=UPI00234DF20F|nr:C4b-binding protein alpha chain-like isoform X2 [Nycticebus coucang]
MSSELQGPGPAWCLFGVLTLLLCPSGLCDCKMPPLIDHGFYKDMSSFLSFTTMIHYECDEGYVLDGKAKITCSHSRWSSPAPQCKALCLKPEIENGKLSVDENQYVEHENIAILNHYIEPENVTVQCDPGYGVVGPKTITCTENGTWYPKVPKCEWDMPNGCEKVFTGKKLMKCLPSPEDVKMALEVYKLSLEIKQLEQK